MTWLKIWWLKRKLRNAYARANSWKNYMDCGRHMASIIRPDLLTQEQEFDRIADELATFDPTGPTFRFRDNP